MIKTGGLLLLFAFGLSVSAQAGPVFNKRSIQLHVGDVASLHLKSGTTDGLQWESSAPQIAEVFGDGFVVGLKPGRARILVRNAANETATCVVSVKSAGQSLVNPAKVKQYPDDRAFTVGGRKCYGSELNGQRAFDPDEKRFTLNNRVINPHPPRPDKPLDWELMPETEVYDGAGVLMGTVRATREGSAWRPPVSMFNFGASKVLHGRICVYAFSVPIVPSPAMAGLLDPVALHEDKVATSAWVPLDNVLAKGILLERIGLGKARLPALPLKAVGYRVTGGNPKQYLTPYGELSLHKVSIGAVPSHYLRRPSGTVNLVYSVPGFGLGGEGTDSFLVSDGVEFYPATGARIFKQHTYFPPGHPQAGKISPDTMTFLYGAIKSDGSEPVYGWIAREALAPR